MNNENCLYIVMPAYNEQDNVKDTVEQWHPIVEQVGGNSRLVIFNDGSKDHTYERMKELEAQYPFFTAETKSNSGHGSTCLFAYKYALEHGADAVFQTDSDGQTDPGEFWKLWNERDNYDFLIGSRNQRQDGFSRVLVTKVLRIIIRIIFGVYVQDANTPFRLMKKEYLAEYLRIIPPDFFLANVVISTIAVKRKQRIFWTPITFKPRQKGTNSINIKRIFKIGWKAIRDFRIINQRI
jgi:glycosyltransferase involved in cell wall biosynthesis